MSSTTEISNQEKMIGCIYTVSAYLLWGFLGLYWNALGIVSSMEILAHRILWGFLFIFTIMIFKSNKRAAFFTLLKEFKGNLKQFLFFFVASLAISGNWLIFIWAVIFGHMMEASLGLYITPIVSMILSVLIVKERIQKGTLLSMLMAFIGVLVISFDYGKIPWIAMSLAITSGIYGLAKKYIKADAMVGMCIETMMVTPFSLCILVFLQRNHKMYFGSDIHLTLLLIFAGILTVLPLLWFTEGLKRISLVTIGFFQYITPTITFLLAVFIFKNTITLMHWISYSFIWLSLAVFSFSSWKGKNKKMRKDNNYVFQE